MTSATPNLEATLAERGKRYASFRDNARVAQNLKVALRDSPNWNKAPGYIQEGLDMIASKISRMLTGELLYPDNIHDLVGYASLIELHTNEDLEMTRDADFPHSFRGGL